MKHKLSGYAIKGDGTQETAERIRKAFEADGVSTCGWSFISSKWYYYIYQHRVDGYRKGFCEEVNINDYTVIPLTEAEDLVYGDQIIPDEAERIVFGSEKPKRTICGCCQGSGWETQFVTMCLGCGGNGDVRVQQSKPTESDELKVGDMVIGWAIYRDGVDYHEKPWEIGAIWHKPDLGGVTFVSPKVNPNHNCNINSVRRATITDFLRTLPDDIAERALRQVGEPLSGDRKYPTSLRDAINKINPWKATHEDHKFWSAVYEGNYDRARAILAEKDRVGKWWRMEFGGVAATFMVTSDNDGFIHGYGFDNEKGWFDRSDTSSSDYICLKSALDANATPATPEEVEAMLDAELNKKYPVGTKFKCVFSGKTFRRHQQSHYNINKKDWSAHIDGFSVLENGKWAEIITPAPEKAEPKLTGKQWMMIPTKEDECIVVWIEHGGLKYKFEKAVEINGCTTVQIDTNEPQTTDNFPRVMWVWNDEPENAKKEEIKRHGSHAAPWDDGWNCWEYASDTHPVTGEPAVKKDVVEQIRDFRDKYFSENGTLTGQKYAELTDIINNHPQP